MRVTVFTTTGSAHIFGLADGCGQKTARTTTKPEARRGPRRRIRITARMRLLEAANAQL